jgi:hypothetical protein
MILLVTGCKTDTQVKSTVGVVGEYSPVTRAEVARMLALSKYGLDEIRSMQREILFTDTNSSLWYDKYINAAYKAQLISGADETHFNPTQYLTLRQAQYLLNKLSGGETLKLEYAEEDRNKPIAYSMWCEGFGKAASKGGLNVKEEEIIVIGEAGNCPKLDADYRITDKGVKHFEGITDSYASLKLKVLASGDEVLAVEEITSDKPTIDGAVILKNEKNGVRVKLNGCERFFYYDGEKYDEGETVSIEFEGDEITMMNK